MSGARSRKQVAEVLQTIGVSGDLIDGIPVQNKRAPLSPSKVRRARLRLSCLFVGRCKRG